MKFLAWVKENLALVMAFVLPFVVIVVVAVSAYVPALFLTTDYDFIYVTCTSAEQYRASYECAEYLQQRYVITDGILAVQMVDFTQNPDYEPMRDTDESFDARIFLHDTKNNVSREITLEEATTQNIHALLTSPDGVTVSRDGDRNYNGDFFFFGSRSSGVEYYLTKGSLKRKINYINNGTDYYKYNVRFIGWVPAMGT